MQEFDAIWVNGHLATFRSGEGEGDGYGSVMDGALAVRDGRIVWVGARTDLPPAAAKVEHDMGGGWLLPGLVDCHTHLIFGGDRAGEFERRLLGESYEAIARTGGGIRSTVAATRSATSSDLTHRAGQLAHALIAEGVTTLEVKSGYGLDSDTELKMLRVARVLGRSLPITVRATFLGPHAVPAEFESDPDGFIELLVLDVLPRVVDEGLADQVDAFLERIAFSGAQCARFLSAGVAAGLGARLHADQLSDGGGAELAAGLGARSADHLEFTGENGVRAMAAKGCTAVLLPGAFYTLGETQLPPVADLRRSGVPIAVASDLNPGSSPLRSLLVALNMACVLFGLRPAEALRGVTTNAAPVLGLADRGRLERGLRADLSLWHVEHPRELCYWVGGTGCAASWAAGRAVVER